MKHIKSIVFTCVAIWTVHHTQAQLSVNSLFSDHMILQRDDKVKIWGKANPKSKVSVQGSWSKSSVSTNAKESGDWSVQLPTSAAGGPYTLTISAKETIKINDVLLGDIWLCSGQSNMEFPMKGYLGQPVSHSNMDVVRSTNPNIRSINIPRKSTTQSQYDFEGQWQSASPATTGDFSAAAYYFARLVNELTQVPIGLIDVTYGGSNVEAWMTTEAIGKNSKLEIPNTDEEIGEKNRTPTVLFHGMLAPVIGYTLKGVIWYQGESNANAPLDYEKLFPDMVKLWRNQWAQGDFPFYFTQIAPFNYDAFYRGEEKLPWYANSGYLRDAQRKSQNVIPNSGMACLLDVGDMENIHPLDKQTPGERLALLALHDTYGFEGFGYATPDVDQLNIEDSLVTVTFRHLPNGLTSYGKEVTAFEIAGEDRVFYPAQCKVRRKSVQVWSDKVKTPVAIRYAFTNEGPAQLFSTEGLPISSFRTDNWNPEP